MNTAPFFDWVFPTCSEQETKTEDVLSEFFNTLDFVRSEEYLVRESFQNSGDAALAETEPVRIRIFVSGSERALSASTAQKYFGGLLPHFEACPELKGEWADLLHGHCEFVVIEDFGTTGLTGDELTGMHINDERNAFYHFWRTSARTDKNTGSGGSWGVGKFVYIMTSKSRTMFGLTTRDHELPNRRSLLFGQSALRYHRINGTIFSKHGYFGIHPEGTEAVPPYTGANQISEFAEDWNLERRDQTGLSIVIPHARSIDSESLLLSIVKEYGGRILQRQLVVDLDLPDIEPLRLSHESLFDIFDTRAGSPEWREVHSLLTLLVEASSPDTGTHVQLPLVVGGKSWNELVLPEETLNDLTKTFHEHGMLRVRVPVQIERKSGDKEQSFFDVLLRNEEGSEPIAPVYFRNGLRISGKAMGTKSNGVRSIFIAGSGILGEMLRFAEGPAHTEWTGNRETFKNRYKNDSVWITFCRTAPHKLVQLARGGNSENDFQSLSDLFPDPDYQASNSAKPRPASRGSGNSSTGAVEVEQEGQIPVRLSGIDGGFVLKLDRSTEVNELLIEMAYARLRGNTFSKWSPADFSASRLQLEIHGGQILSKSKNRIVTLVEHPSTFKLSVTGFDSKRDLRVRASENMAV